MGGSLYITTSLVPCFFALVGLAFFRAARYSFVMAALSMTGATSAGAGATAAVVSGAGITFEESESVFLVSLLLHADARTKSPHDIIKNFNFMSFDLIVILVVYDWCV